ncbi:MAG: tetratricopeptide repeat protein [Bacteroidales bacterium]|jgi:clan AA aspartic protease (TIGR02281 family)|nr:tetratricopeptide repeat protein [Bacteroidales bacterium]
MFHTYPTPKFFTVLFAIFIAVSTLTIQAQEQTYSFYRCLDYYAEKDYNNAIDCLTDHLAQYPKDVDALNIRARCFKSISNYLLAFSDIDNAIKYHHKKSKSSLDGLYTNRGLLYEDIENYEEALKDYAKALKINPKNTETMFYIANLYFLMDRFTESDAVWNKILKIDKNNMRAQIGLAKNMIYREEPEEAIKAFNRLEKIDKTNPKIYYYRSMAYVMIDDYRNAVDDLFSLCFHKELDYHIIGLILDCAEYEFTYTLAKTSKEILNDNNDKVLWVTLRAELYANKEMYREAIEDFNTIEALISTPDIFVFTRRGYYYSEMGEYDKAIEEYEKGIDLMEDIDLFRLRGSAHRLKGEFKTAIEDYSNVIELDPMNYYAYYLRGWTKEFANDDQGALKDYTTAIELNREYAYPYFERGDLYQRALNQPLLAEKDFEKVLELEKETHISKSGNCRQYALFHLGRIEEAIEFQNAILEKYPTSSNYYDAACLYSAMNRKEDAIKYLQLAFEKGIRYFIHIENDIYLNNIRNTPEFINLIEEWKQKVAASSLETGQVIDTEFKETQRYVVKMKEQKSGVYEMPCKVNDLPLNFIFDTGASIITISSLEAAFMLKNNYLNEYDFKSKKNYQTASGDIMEGTKIVLRKVMIGDLELNNIEATVVHKQNAPLLFGQSALSKFVKISIDNKNSEIVFEY